jgi:hypothetical protein
MRNWRKLTWVILVVQGLFLYWIIAATSMTVSKSCEGLSGNDLSICQSGTAVGAGLAIGFLVFLWAAVDVILGIIWLITNRKSRSCPTCGRDVKKGLTVCKGCGFDFVKANSSS